MLCNYGSSEYSQAFSRIGSLNGSIYIVNDELKISKLNFDISEENSLKSFKSIEINYSKYSKYFTFIYLDDTPIVAKKGLIAGADYQSWINK